MLITLRDNGHRSIPRARVHIQPIYREGQLPKPFVNHLDTARHGWISARMQCCQLKGLIE